MVYQINGESYTYLSDYKDDEHLRASFNQLTRLSFEFDFENWYQEGYWLENYRPYSLLCADQIVANVSANIMHFDCMGQTKTYIQLGTVMTHPDYRHKSLSRFLMDKVLAQWQAQCEMVYLFANETVLDFYPKFGFKQLNEYQCIKSVNSVAPSLMMEKINLADSTWHKQNFIKKIQQAQPVSPLAMKDNVPLILFYCLDSFADHIYYLKTYDAYVIAEYNERVFYLQDVFCASELAIHQLLEQITPAGARHVKLGFMPFDQTGFDQVSFVNDKTRLFASGKDKMLFEENRLMFPLLSHT